MSVNANTHELRIGVDIGGTKVAAGLIAPNGVVLSRERVPMVATRDAMAGFAAVEAAIQSVLEKHELSGKPIAGIGVCSPGPLDPRTGVVINPPNLPCWRNFPLAGKVQHRFGVATKVDNDANAAALAETIWGAGIGFQNVFYATLGTGVGTGIIFDQQIYHGRTGSAAEGGHMTIDYRGSRANCGCGKPGCVEGLCSGNSIARRARERVLAGANGARLVELAGGSVEQITGEHVGMAYQQGDTLATDVLRETADFLTIWFGNIVDLLEPDVIIVGGGVAELMSSFFGHIREELPNWSINQRCQEIPIVKARYGNDAGIVGAAALIGDVIVQAR